jgi:hypothetical protein
MEAPRMKGKWNQNCAKIDPTYGQNPGLKISDVFVVLLGLSLITHWTLFRTKLVSSCKGLVFWGMGFKDWWFGRLSV